ncbi:glutathione s transferase d10 isoform a-related [Holotrichia oblita]|uniref:Glutathione s transferase d10 isoform a-related n=1 Tax=Holotrichia oblita TaxID=644536 RepID=A0ACB9T010_HOLOL|nr:glutathione s transferase d10 isoform a-related [Holotrichia oblita]
MDLYVSPTSPPCNAVLLVARALKLKLNVKEVNVRAGETKTPEFLKMNPQHTVPTLDDYGFYLWESRAIMIYLVNKYGRRDDPLYPRDAKLRAMVESRLYFDATTLYPALSKCYYPVFMGTQTAPNPEDYKKVQEAFDIMDKFVENTEFMAGNKFSIADICLLVTVSSIVQLQFDLSPYQRVSAWFNRAKEICPGYDDILMKSFSVVKELYGKNLKGVSPDT